MMRQGLEVFVLVALSATVCVAQDASGGLGSGVFDEARLFSGAAVARGVESLRAFEKAKRHPIYVVTAESLDGQSPRDRAIAEAGRRGPGGLTILITKKDHRIFVWPDPDALDVFPRSLTVDLSDALLRALRQGQPDEALHAATTILMASSGAVAKPEKAADSFWTADVGDAGAGQALFNGEDLGGWSVVVGDPKLWSTAEREVRFAGDLGAILTETDYSDFELGLEYKLGEGADAGVALRCQPSGDPSASGWEVRLIDEGVHRGLKPTERHGAILGVSPPLRSVAKPVGEWNRLRVVAQNRKIFVSLNDVAIQDFDLNARQQDATAHPGLFRTGGRIGLRGRGGAVAFRNVNVREIQGQPAPVFDSGGHQARVTDVAFTPDGRSLVSVSFDKSVRVWDVARGRLTATFRPPSGRRRIGELFAVAVSPDGRTIAVAGYYAHAYLIELESGRLVRSLDGHSNSIESLAFSPDGRQVATASGDGTARTWDVKTGRVVRTFSTRKIRVHQVAYSPDGSRLAAVLADGGATVWSIEGGASVAELPKEAHATSLAWTPDGTRLASGTSDAKVVVWDLAGQVQKTVAAPGRVGQVRFVGGSRKLLYTWSTAKLPKPESGAVVLDLESGKPLSRFDQSTFRVLCGAVSPDGVLAATAGDDPADLRIWRTEDGEQRHQLRGKGSVKWSAGWGPDGHEIVWGNELYRDRAPRLNDQGPLDHSFRFDSLELGEPRGAMVRGRSTSGELAFKAEGPKTIAVMRGQEVVNRIDATPFGGQPGCVTWLDGERLLVGSVFGDLTMVEARTGKLIRRYQGHLGAVRAIAPSPDGRYFLTAAFDHVLRVWSSERAATLLVLYVTDGGDWVASTPGGYYAASPGGEQLIGWRVGRGMNAMASYYPATQFRRTLYRPDVIKRLLEDGSLESALAGADAAGGREGRQVEVAEILPPKVAITSPKAGRTRIETASLAVEAIASNSGAHPLTALRLLLDGRPVPDGLKVISGSSLDEGRGSWTVEMPQGRHTLAVQAESAVSKGVSERVEIVRGDEADATKSSGTLYVLAIGINRYAHLGSRFQLGSAGPDARSVVEAFREHSRSLYKAVQSRTLVDGQATRANMLKSFRWLKDAAKPGDKAVVFYAGHGDNRIAGRFCILPADAKLDDLKSTGISDGDLERAVGELPCTTVLILDACYAGSFGEASRKAQKKARKPGSLSRSTDALAGSLVNEYGLAILCGARGDQEAIEEGGHGFFTQALVSGLAGDADGNRDGVVELYELLPFVKSRVGQLSAGDQVPVVGLPLTVESFPLAKP